MEKNRKINIRKILWYVIYALPLLAYLFALWGGVSVAFNEIVSQFALPFMDSVIGQSIQGLLGTNGTLPLLNDTVLNYCNYFVGCQLLHIVLDVILFLPNVLQKMFEKLDKERDS